MSLSKALYEKIFGHAWHVAGADIGTLLTYVTYAGDPTNNVTPAHIGQMCFNTSSSTFYIATGLAAANWKIVTT